MPRTFSGARLQQFYRVTRHRDAGVNLVLRSAIDRDVKAKARASRVVWTDECVVISSLDIEASQVVARWTEYRPEELGITAAEAAALLERR